MDLKSLYLLNTHVVTCRAVGLCGFRNSLLVFIKDVHIVVISLDTVRTYGIVGKLRIPTP